MREKILLIDAGHGGTDPNTGEYTTDPRTGKKFQHEKGTFHNGSWFYEGVSNRDFSAEFISQATRQGFVCVPVIHPSADTSLMKRIKFANYYYQNINSNCIYISFHSNAFKTTNRGLQVYHHPNSSKGRELASNIVDTTEYVFLDWDSVWPFNCVKQADFAVLRATIMPAVLIENGFFDNYEDALLLRNSDFASEVCRGILNGIAKTY